MLEKDKSIQSKFILDQRIRDLEQKNMNLLEEMAAYKVPQVVEFRDELPRSPTGKVMWRALQEQEWASQQEQQAS